MKRFLNFVIDTMSTPPTDQPIGLGAFVPILVALLVLVGAAIATVDGQTLLFQIPVSFAFAIFTGALLSPVVSGRGRRRLAEWPSGRRYIAIFLVWVMACMVFVLLTGTLFQQGVLRLEGADVTDSNISFKAFGFYVWHFLDSVPLLNIPKTLRWTPPYDYRDTWSGMLLITFKILVIIPVIAAITIRKASPTPPTIPAPN